jgi:RIO-like serine/threonine protein kinase
MAIRNELPEDLMKLIGELYKNNSWDKLTKISSDDTSAPNCAGYSTVYELNEEIIVKVFNKDAYQKDILAEEHVEYDYVILEALYGTGLVPKLYLWEPEKFVVMEKVNGVSLFDSHKENPIVNRMSDKRYQMIIQAIQNMITLGWQPADLKPFHIFFSDDQVKFIDFTMYSNVGDSKLAFDYAEIDLNTYMDNYLK